VSLLWLLWPVECTIEFDENSIASVHGRLEQKHQLVQSESLLSILQHRFVDAHVGGGLEQLRDDHQLVGLQGGSCGRIVDNDVSIIRRENFGGPLRVDIYKGKSECCECCGGCGGCGGVVLYHKFCKFLHRCHSQQSISW